MSLHIYQPYFSSAACHINHETFAGGFIGLLWLPRKNSGYSGDLVKSPTTIYARLSFGLHRLRETDFHLGQQFVSRARVYSLLKSTSLLSHNSLAGGNPAPPFPLLPRWRATSAREGQGRGGSARGRGVRVGPSRRRCRGRAASREGRSAWERRSRAARAGPAQELTR